MRITHSRSTGAARTTIMRTLGDDNERHLVIRTPWQQPDAKTIAAVWNDLTDEEQREVAAAFGIDPIPPEEAV
jgi:hypothetical protein